MNTILENNSIKLDNAMTKQAAEFRSLMHAIEGAFYDLPAPESNNLTWSHVGSAEHVNNELRDILKFLTR